MAKTGVVVVIVDILLLAALVSVLQDLQWRIAYAASPHAATPGYSPSFSYGILMRFFTMAGNGVSLTSPPTFDWVQALVIALVIINAWYAYYLTKSRRTRPAVVPISQRPNPAKTA